MLDRRDDDPVNLEASMSNEVKIPLLSVRNLHRRFRERTVLEVPLLQIYPGELVAIVGYSGCGKTTLIETLGLMSQCDPTELGEARIVYHLSLGGKELCLDLASIWRDEDLLTRVRADHLSFMFQRANLLPTLSGTDNVRISLLLQGDPPEDARSKAEEKLTSLGLSNDGQDIRNYSGGMLQRLAFARAVLPRFQLLFADEPTGNLDPENGKVVWRQLKESLNPIGGAAAILVVTHDLDLACQFASRIVVIGKDGYLNPEHSLDLDSAPLSASDLKQKVQSWMAEQRPVQLVPTNEQDGPRNTLGATGGTGTAVNSKLSIRPGQERLLALWRNVPMFTLLRPQKLAFLGMICVSLLALGLAQGTRNFLETRMSDPYVSWLSLDLPFEQRGKAEAVTQWLEQNGSRYGVKDSRHRHAVTLQLWESRVTSKPKLKRARGITIGYEEPLAQRVCEMLVAGGPCQTVGSGEQPTGRLSSPFRSDRDVGLVVTKDLIQSLGHNGDEGFVLASHDGGATDRAIALPIRAVVTALPEGEQLAMTPYMRKQLYFARLGPLDPESSTDLTYFLPSTVPRSLEQSVNSALRTAGALTAAQVPIARSEEYQESSKPGWILRLSFSLNVSLSDRDTLDQWLSAQSGLLPKTHRRIYSWTPDDAALQRPDDTPVISLNLDQSQLGRAPELRAELQRLHGAELDVARVEALKNYDSVAFSSTLMSGAVMLLSGLCAGVFISYSLYTQLIHMREFLGTLMAFGASRQTLEAILRRRLGVQLAQAFGMAFPMVLVIGYAAFSGVSAQLLGIPLAPGERLFSFWNGWILGFVLLMFGLGVLCVHWISQRLLRKDPGALIYDRLA